MTINSDDVECAAMDARTVRIAGQVRLCLNEMYRNEDKEVAVAFAHALMLALVVFLKSATSRAEMLDDLHEMVAISQTVAWNFKTGRTEEDVFV